MYGVTPTGFNRPTVQELIEMFERDQRSEISDTLDVSPESPLGQINGIFARHLGIAWEALEIAYHAFDPERAEDFLLTALAKLTGTTRQPATYSRVALECVLEEGTTLESGTHFAAVDGDSENRWTPVEDFTAPSDGVHTVVFRAERPGPITASAETITVIATPVVGWSDPLTNPSQAVPGSAADDDATLRQRREDELARAGSATVRAIRAELSRLTGMISVRVIENTSNETVEGRPPKSFEAIIYDAGAVADNDIAQAIWDSKPAGITAYGADSGTATDELGDAQTVAFTRVDAVDIHIEYTLTARPNYVGDETFAATVAARLSAQFTPGDDVTTYDLIIVTHDLGCTVTSVAFGTAESPSSNTPITITERQIARFTASNITRA